ncbi:MAG: flagellar protein FlaG [Azonexus sp.]
MNIDSISSAGAPPRTALPEGASTPATRVPETAKPPPAAENQDKKPPSQLEAKQAIEKIAEFVSSRQSELSFSIDDASGTQIVKITDIQTKQIIRQFPSEEAIAIAHALDKLQGLLIKDKV